MGFYSLFIIFIVIIKILFILTTLAYRYYQHKGDKKRVEQLDYWRERLEFIFIACMSVLLIYLFNPRSNRPVVLDGETKILLYLYGIIILLTADWGLFVKESGWFKYLQNAIGKRNS